MSVLLEIEIPCILLFLNRTRNGQNSPKIKECTHNKTFVKSVIDYLSTLEDFLRYKFAKHFAKVAVGWARNKARHRTTKYK